MKKESDSSKKEMTSHVTTATITPTTSDASSDGPPRRRRLHAAALNPLAWFRRTPLEIYSGKNGIPLDRRTEGSVIIATTEDTSNVTSNSSNNASTSRFDTTTSWVSSSLGLNRFKSQRKVLSPEEEQLKSLGFEQQLSRTFDFWSSWGLAMCNIGMLPGTFLGIATILEVGGPSLYSVGWPITGLFMCFVSAALGEFASTFPVAGAMFTWTFRLSRSSRTLDPWARFLSWFIGLYTFVYHTLVQVVITFQFSNMIISLASIYSYVHTSVWTSIAISWALLIVSGLVVSLPVSNSPRIWKAGGAFIVAGWVAVITILCVTAPRFRSARYVFTAYDNKTGWSSKAIVYLVGWVQTCLASGLEASAHLAEDTKRPTRNVPLAIFWSTACSYVMGFVMITIRIATFVDPDHSEFRPIRLISGLSRPIKTALMSILCCALLLQSVAQLTASSRFTWALAREGAFPFSKTLQRVSRRTRQPMYALWLIVLLAALLLMLLAIEENIVGTILLENAAWASTLIYLAPIFIYVFFAPKDVLVGDGRAEFTLRKFSRPIAAISVVFLVLFSIVLCFPTGYPVTATTLSYTSPGAVVVSVTAVLTWIFYGNAHYSGPIKATTKWTIGTEVDIRNVVRHAPSENQVSEAPSSHRPRRNHTRVAFSNVHDVIPIDTEPSSAGSYSTGSRSTFSGSSGSYTGSESESESESGSASDDSQYGPRVHAV